MKNDPSVKNFDGSQAALYPHLKITNEAYPRILATRKIEDDGAEYFGAFLTKTATRILIDFLNKTFRIRSCDVPIDGKFSVPCTQYYHRRCLAPCVESLCTKNDHDAMIELVRLFLANRRSELAESLQFRIQLTSDALDFETAAYWRDILEACDKYWSNPRWNVWLDGDVVDTFAIDDKSPDLRIYLITQRKRYVLGRKVFSFGFPTTLYEAINAIVENFYRFYAPREIRVTEDFADRRKLAKRISEKFRRDIKISVIRNKSVRVTTVRAARLARDEIELDSVRPQASGENISARLKEIFELPTRPICVVAFDAAHISGNFFVSANSAWGVKGFRPSEYQIRFGERNRGSELDTLASGVVGRLAFPWLETPDLVILDGGVSQLNKVKKHLYDTNHPKAPIVAAVKPFGRHSLIKYFLTEGGQKVTFDESDPAHNMLKRLRDDAHDLANRAHRDLRDMAHNYELAEILPSINESRRREVLRQVGSVSKIKSLTDDVIFELSSDRHEAKAIRRDLRNFLEGKANPIYPLIVPIRFDEENGSADDLRPIATR